MKILIIGDVHWSQYSSIVRKRGKQFSVRLENLITSVNWAETFAETARCDSIIYVGDFFDRPDINAEELTALNAISWSNIHHTFLVGNHEMASSDLTYSSSHVFDIFRNASVIAQPCKYIVGIAPYQKELCFLPYTLSSDELCIKELFGAPTLPRVVISHNDIADISLGRFKSIHGFKLQDIEDNCSLFLNGHIHNGSHITQKVINVGNLTGQNFSEDGFTYQHHIVVLDTDTLELRFIKNPYALNFYKLEFETDDFSRLDKTENAVITCKVSDKNKQLLTDYISQHDNIVESRCVIYFDNVSEQKQNISEILSEDHVKQFCEYIIQNIGDTPIIREELQEISV